MDAYQLTYDHLSEEIKIRRGPKKEIKLIIIDENILFDQKITGDIIKIICDILAEDPKTAVFYSKSLKKIIDQIPIDDILICSCVGDYSNEFKYLSKFRVYLWGDAYNIIMNYDNHNLYKPEICLTSNKILKKIPNHRKIGGIQICNMEKRFKFNSKLKLLRLRFAFPAKNGENISHFFEQCEKVYLLESNICNMKYVPDGVCENIYVEITRYEDFDDAFNCNPVMLTLDFRMIILNKKICDEIWELALKSEISIIKIKFSNDRESGIELEKKLNGRNDNNTRFKKTKAIMVH